MSSVTRPVSTIYDLLAAYLSKKGVSQQELDQFGHDLPAMVDRAEKLGLKITPRHRIELSAKGRIYRERNGGDSIPTNPALMAQIIRSLSEEPKERRKVCRSVRLA